SRGFTISITSGDNQQTRVNTSFPNPLAVIITSAFGEPVQAGVVTFSAPGSGASATFPSGSTATLDASGLASVSVAANGVPGRYTATAATRGAPGVTFALQNGTIFTVVNTLDGGPGSLRQAILDANANPGRDLIEFSIPRQDTSGL